MEIITAEVLICLNKSPLDKAGSRNSLRTFRSGSGSGRTILNRI